MRVVKVFGLTLSLTMFFLGFFVGTIAFLGALVFLAWTGNFRAIAVLVVSSMWLAFLAVVYRRYLRDDWPR